MEAGRRSMTGLEAAVHRPKFDVLCSRGNILSQFVSRVAFCPLHAAFAFFTCSRSTLAWTPPGLNAKWTSPLRSYGDSVPPIFPSSWDRALQTWPPLPQHVSSSAPTLLEWKWGRFPVLQVHTLVLLPRRSPSNWTVRKPLCGWRETPGKPKASGSLGLPWPCTLDFAGLGALEPPPVPGSLVSLSTVST